MKNLFLCFRPYHIQVSNLIKNELETDENRICIFENKKWEVYADKYDEIKIYFAPEKKVRVKDYLINFKFKKALAREVNELEKFLEEYKPERVFIYSDNPIYIQKIVDKVKGKVILVEEGLALYNKAEDKYNNKTKLVFFIEKMLGFKYKKAKLFTHGKSGLEDIVLAREPKLLENKSKKIKLDDKFIRRIFTREIENYNLDIDTGYLYCPAATEYNKEKMIEINDYIFKKFSELKIKLYIKLHPVEKYKSEIASIVEKYSKYVKIIENNEITSEEIIIREKIIGVISDYSSTLVNTYYINKEIKIYSTLLLMKKMGIEFKWNISIFNELRKKGVIGDFTKFTRCGLTNGE